MVKEDNFDVAVIGSGPAGIMAAGTAAESGVKVILLEKNNELSKKLLLTGNGRCNITNAEFNLRDLVENYGKNGKFLFHAFSVFGPKETIAFFKNIGVETKIESNKRIFPVSERAKDVRDALYNYLVGNNVVIRFNSEVLKIISKNKKIEKIILRNKEIKAKKYIFCTGGSSYPITGSNGFGYELMKNLGHTITDLSPALVPIKTKEYWVKELQGLSLKNVEISVLQNNKKMISETGDILFTHFGLSGPAILNMSKKIGELLNTGKVKISIDIKPTLNFEQLQKKIDENFKNYPGKYLKSYLYEFMPKRMVPVFTKTFNINSDIHVNNIKKGERIKLAKYLKNIESTVEGLLGFDFAMVTSGGVSVKEIDDKTMKSKIINNLFFAGEIINIDAKTGGFNLQLCWSTGYLSGKSIGIGKN